MFIAALLLAAALPSEWTLAGQEATCGRAARARTFDLKAEEQVLDVGNGVRAAVMTLGGRLAPVLEACEGDRVTLRVRNAGEMAHGIDSHAFRIDPEKFGPVDSGGTVEYSGVLGTPGAFMFHCASGPVTDVHIKSGMWGAMIVYPRKRLPKAREVAILQGALFGQPDEQNVIHGDTAMMARNEPYTLTFNGRMEHEAVQGRPGERIRVWFVNAGPGISSPHVMGTMFDRVAASGNPRNAELDVQTALVPAGGGAMLEFRLPEKGMYMLVDHDNLRYLNYGFAIAFVAGPEQQAMRSPREHGMHH
ncbi:MAG TPA: multicopper oxidase domain-containing protein [Myxococcales bacterium]|nr:multicopper oxidase domain-containing protein [Myxococcales bacterium]